MQLKSGPSKDDRKKRLELLLQQQADNDEIETIHNNSSVVQKKQVPERIDLISPAPSNHSNSNGATPSPDIIDNTPVEIPDEINCTACSKKIKWKVKKVCKHPRLGVILCKSCLKFINSNDYARDEQGVEEFCTWCGDGGNLVCCDFCEKAYCKHCIKRNLGKPFLKTLLEATEEVKWKCFHCDQSQISVYISQCSIMMNHVHTYRAHESTIEVKKTHVGDGLSLKDREKRLKHASDAISKTADSQVKMKSSFTEQNSGEPKANVKTEEPKIKQEKEKDKKKSVTVVLSSSEESDEEIVVISKSGKKTVLNKAVLMAAQELLNKKGDSDTKKESKKKQDPLENKEEEEAKEKPKKTKKKLENFMRLSLSNSKKQSEPSSESDSPPERSSSSESSDDEVLSKKKKREMEIVDGVVIDGEKPGPSGIRSKRKSKKRKEKVVKNQDASSDEDEFIPSIEALHEKRREEAKEQITNKMLGPEPTVKFIDQLPIKPTKTARRSNEGSNSHSPVVDKENNANESDSTVKDTDDKNVEDPENTSKETSEEVVEKADESDDETIGSPPPLKELSEKALSCSVSLTKLAFPVNNESLDKEDSGETKEDEVVDKHTEADNDVEMNEPEIDSDSGEKDIDSNNENNEIDDSNKENNEESKHGKKEDEKKEIDESGESEGEDKKRSENEDEDEDEKEQIPPESDDSDDDESQPKQKFLRKRKPKDDSNEDSDVQEVQPKKKKQRQKNKSDSDVEEVRQDAEVVNSDDSDFEEATPKRSTRQSRRTKGKKKDGKKATKKKKKNADDDDAETVSSGSDVQTKSTRRRRRKQSDSSFEEISSDDSDDDEIQHTIESESDESSDASIIITRKKNQKDKGKKKKGGRGKKKKKKNSSDEDEESDEEGKSPTKGRKKIRKIMKDNQLTEETRHARELEEQRRQRLLDRTAKDRKEYTKVLEISEGEYVLERNKDKQPLVSVSADINKHLKPHQRKGIQFMYDCCIESINGYKKGDEGGGCLLAHCMGLGKTLQIVSFTSTIEKSENIKMKRFLIVAPLNTVLNWEQEYEKWLSVEDRMDVYVMSRCNGMKDRVRTLKEWFEDGGALIIGYEMYRNLVNFTFVKGKKMKEQITEYLVDPGPDLVVCDEGHILRNNTSAISIAMNKVKTRRRIVLTGTPLQNNLPEYHVMVDFVKPNLLGTKKEFLNRFANPINNGRCSNSTPRDVRIMKQRCHVLYQLLSGCVQRQDYSVLTPFLPMKREYTIFVRMQPKQTKMYQHYLENFVYQDAMNKLKGSSLFSDFHCLSRIWCHPWSLHLERLRRLARQKSPDSMEEFLDDNEESSASESEGKKPWDENTDSEEENEDKRRKRRKKFDSSDEETSASEREDEDEKPTMVAPAASARATRASRRAGDIAAVDLSEMENGDSNSTDADVKTRGSLRSGVNFKDGAVKSEDNKEKEYDERKSANEFSEWYDEFLTQEDETNVELSGKLVIMLEIIANAEVVGDKILVFTQSLASLDLIESALGGGSIGGNQLNWCRGIDYFRMDGSTPVQKRKRWSDTFNDPDNDKCRLFLISTKAGSLGINMVAANRVIIFDCSWNPSHDVQSVFRVFRFGQEKPVYVYRLIAQGTMEEKVYDRQITKLAVASRVVDEMQIERHFTHEEIRELYSFRPEAIGPNPETPQLPKDPLLAEVLQRQHPQYIVRYHEHDLLLANVQNEEMSEEEKQQAWKEYEDEKNMSASRLQYRQNLPPVQGGAESFQQMMASQQQMVEKRMQQFYNPNTGVRFNIVVPSNLSPSEQAIYEAAIRRNIVSKLGNSAAGGTLQNIRLPATVGAQSSYNQLPANRIVNVNTGAQQQTLRFHSANPQQRHNNGPSSVVRVLAPNDTARQPIRPPLDPSKFPPPPINNLK